jgi:hypothetical protein
VAINSLAVISGKLPARATGLVVEWASVHQAELRSFWQKAKNLEPLGKVASLEKQESYAAVAKRLAGSALAGFREVRAGTSIRDGKVDGGGIPCKG